jgi:hypothetical protein
MERMGHDQSQLILNLIRKISGSPWLHQWDEGCLEILGLSKNNHEPFPFVWWPEMLSLVAHGIGHCNGNATLKRLYTSLLQRFVFSKFPDINVGESVAIMRALQSCDYDKDFCQALKSINKLPTALQLLAGATDSVAVKGEDLALSLKALEYTLPFTLIRIRLGWHRAAGCLRAAPETVQITITDLEYADNCSELFLNVPFKWLLTRDVHGDVFLHKAFRMYAHIGILKPLSARILTDHEDVLVQDAELQSILTTYKSEPSCARLLLRARQTVGTALMLGTDSERSPLALCDGLVVRKILDFYSDKAQQ